ncbi:MAG: LamG domain-containing protein, partial [Phycisphaeraceae bacterium]
LANGSEGYIPPPEQHALGGYNTWPARTAALEVDAEPKIVDAVLGLLEEVSGQPRREFVERETMYARHVLEAEPLAYYRLGELEGPRAWDATGHHEDGAYEPLVVFGLPGVDAPGLANGEGLLDVNRAPHFAGGRVHADLNELGERYSVELWFWTRIAHDVYPVSGYLFSRGLDGSAEADGDHLGIGGNHGDVNGRLFFFNGNGAQEIVAGETVVEPETWQHAVLVRDGERVTLYLDGKREAAGEAAVTHATNVGQIFVGGRNDGFAPFAGRIDEVAVYARLLSDEEVAERYEAAIRANVEP